MEEDQQVQQPKPQPTLRQLTERQQQVWDIIRNSKPGSTLVIGYGGAAGGGKSALLVEAAIRLAINFPGNRGVIGRDEFNKLESTTLQEFDAVCPPQLVVKRHDQPPVYRDIRLPHWPKDLASRIYFRGLANWQSFGSEQFGFACFDEASEIPREAAYYMMSRLRHRLPLDVEQRLAKMGSGMRYVFLAASNPWPGWFADTFHKRSLDNFLDLFEEDDKPEVYFVPSKMRDNPHLPKGYEQKTRAFYLAAGLGEWADRLVEGRFDVYEGRIYEHFNPEIHKWLGPEPTKDNYKRVIGGLDFGGESSRSHFTTGIVGVITHANRLIRVDEFKDRGPDIYEKQARWMIEMQQKWGDPIKKRIEWCADKSQSVGIREWQKSFRIKPSQGGRDSVNEGIKRVAARLEKDGSGIPGSFYLPRLVKWEEEMMTYRRDPETMKIIEEGDDLCDADRYMEENLAGAVGNPMQLFKNAVAVVR